MLILISEFGSGGQGSGAGADVRWRRALRSCSPTWSRPGEEAQAAAIRKSGGKAIFLKLDVTSPGNWANAIQAHSTRIQQTPCPRATTPASSVAPRINAVTMRELAAGHRRRSDRTDAGHAGGSAIDARLRRRRGGQYLIDRWLDRSPRGTAYAAQRMGFLRGVTEAGQRWNLLGWNIGVNSVHPAQVIDTGMAASATPGYSLRQRACDAAETSVPA